MFNRLKKKIDKHLRSFVDKTNQRYQLKKKSPLLFSVIRNFILREGKRIRPILFLCGYCGYNSRNPKNLLTCALSLELLHDFLLVHDDIIDKSDLRRGKPSMHAMLNRHVRSLSTAKFTGQDLSIVAGDIIYAMAIDAFLAVDENKSRKETALHRFIQSAIFTGTGEFVELLMSTRKINEIEKNDIYKIYDLKTAHYTFSSPLCVGAILAGAPKAEIRALAQYGIHLGRAFQIKDDILGILESEQSTGKSGLTDLQEAKRTLLIWHTYRNSNKNEKKIIDAIFKKKIPSKFDLLKIRNLINQTGTIDYVYKEVNNLNARAKKILNKLSMQSKFKNLLFEYTEKYFFSNAKN